MNNNTPSVLRLGVLGLGEGRSLMSAAIQSELWELGQICDLNPDLCKERCREFGFDTFTTNYQDMLEDDSLDVIGIYTPDRFHGMHIEQAMRAGKHVVCTKPLFTDLHQAQQVLRTSRETGKHLLVGQSTRFFESMKKQREEFLSQKLGDLITVEAQYNADARWFLEKEMTQPETFQLLFGCASHPVDLVRWYMPDIVEVMGYGMVNDNGRAYGLTHPDTMHFVMKAESGKIARVTGVYNCPTGPESTSSKMSCSLRCLNGYSEASYPQLRYAYSIHGGESATLDFQHLDHYFFRFSGHSHHAGEYQNYLEHFARNLQQGKTPKPDLIEGIKTVALMVAMQESMEQGLPVDVREVENRYFDPGELE